MAEEKDPAKFCAVFTLAILFSWKMELAALVCECAISSIFTPQVAKTHVLVWNGLKTQNAQGSGVKRLGSLQGNTQKYGNSKNGNSVFSIENNSMWTSFGKKLVTKGNHKNVKTGQQCMSLTKKNWIPFFSFPYFRVLPSSESVLMLMSAVRVTRLSIYYRIHDWIKIYCVPFVLFSSLSVSHTDPLHKTWVRCCSIKTNQCERFWERKEIIGRTEKSRAALIPEGNRAQV